MIPDHPFEAEAWRWMGIANLTEAAGRLRKTGLAADLIDAKVFEIQAEMLLLRPVHISTGRAKADRPLGRQGPPKPSRWVCGQPDLLAGL